MGALPNPFLTIFGISRGRVIDHGVFAIGNARLPSDAIGATSVTFDGVPAGNEIRVYDQDLNELAGVETCTANQILTWSVYAPGSPKNNVQIKIFGIDYKIKDFPYTSRVGDQTVPVQMDTDPWK